MKKKLLTTTLALSLFASVGTAAFAESGNTTISTVEQLKSAVAEDASDGYFSEAEKTALLEQATDEVVSALVSEKLDAAADLLNGQEITAEMQKLPGGTEKAVYTYDLGDNCELVVELLDRAELAGMESGIMPMATSGSSDVWKDYGNRYFTAKASVKCNVATVNFSLENHYILSANGIDMNYGNAYATTSSGGTLMSHENPVITDSTARTPGASDVNMYCIFSCKSGSVGPDKYKINTTVKYLSHDKTGKRIKVGQVWNLVKM